LAAALGTFAPGAFAQDASCDHMTHPNGCADTSSADQVAKQLSNPAGSLSFLAFKNQYRWYKGDLPNADNQSKYTMLFQPVFQFPTRTTESSGKKNIFVRPAFPLLVDQTTFDGSGFKGVTALGDIGFGSRARSR
jgi:hypothetical protein